MAVRLVGPARRTSRRGISRGVGFLLLGRCPHLGKKRGCRVLRALRAEDTSRASGVHAVREVADVRVDSTDQSAGDPFGGDRE
jgi:hypothetical protein